MAVLHICHVNVLVMFILPTIVEYRRHAVYIMYHIGVRTGGAMAVLSFAHTQGASRFFTHESSKDIIC